jgi:hypothetical protein
MNNKMFEQKQMNILSLFYSKLVREYAHLVDNIKL